MHHKNLRDLIAAVDTAVSEDTLACTTATVLNAVPHWGREASLLVTVYTDYNNRHKKRFVAYVPAPTWTSEQFEVLQCVLGKDWKVDERVPEHRWVIVREILRIAAAYIEGF